MDESSGLRPAIWSLGDVFELKIFKSPGYRVYFGIDGDSLVIILSGGDKSSQGRDIDKAKDLWRQYLESRRGHESNGSKKE